MANIQGTGGDDILNGTPDPDTINGLAGNDTINAGDGNDTVNGGTGNDTIDGGLGNDLLSTGGGADIVTGGEGDDQIILDAAATIGGIYDGGAGTDTLVANHFGTGTVVTHVIQNLTQQGVVSIERIQFGSSGGRQLFVSMIAEQYAGSGLTQLIGGAGADRMLFQMTAPGTFTIPTLTLTSWNTNDFIVVQVAASVSGNVTIDGAGHASRLMLDGGAGNDTIIASGGLDFLTGGAGDDVMVAGAGNDQIRGDAGADLMFGGTGDDYYEADQQNDIIFEDAGGGIDSVASTASYYLFANIENLGLAGTAVFGVGNDLDNELRGNASENLLLGGGGFDVIYGGGARDSIFGEDGGDAMYGEAGVDYLVGGGGDDIIDGGDQADEIYGQDGDDDLYGGEDFSTDILVGGDGNDRLDGGFTGDLVGGDFDFLYGNAGDDTYFVDTPADLVFEQAGEGYDIVYAHIVGAGFYLYDNIEELWLGDETPFGVGNGLDNVMRGNLVGNYLLGGGGNDNLNGFAGNDVLFGEAGADTFGFEEGTGADIIGDFVIGQDKIDLSAFGLTFVQLQTLFVQNGNVGAIQLLSGDVIILHNVTMSQLTASDFILSVPAEPLGKSLPVMEPLAFNDNFAMSDRLFGDENVDRWLVEHTNGMFNG